MAEVAAFVTGALDGVAGFAWAAGFIVEVVVGVAGVAVWAGDCIVGFFVSASTGAVFVCIAGLADFAWVAGHIVGVVVGVAAVVWAGDGTVGFFASGWGVTVLVVCRKGLVVLAAGALGAAGLA
jgi:hypothetical protein